MKLANPIYDVVFKYLMEDTEIARRLIGKIIGEEVVELELCPQELTYKTIKHNITVYRLDFKASIKTKDGTRKKVLIELQKAKHLEDIMRFRRYLGDNYMKQDEIKLPDGKVEKVPLPIITIYFLGFRLPAVNTAILKINRVYKDLITNKELEITTDFVEKLTHDSFIIIIPDLKKDDRTELERVLKVFNQSYQLSDKKMLEISSDELQKDDLLVLIADRLNRAASDDDVVRAMEAEEEIEEALDKLVRQIQEQGEKLQEQGEELQEKDEKLQEQERLITALKNQLKERS